MVSSRLLVLSLILASCAPRAPRHAALHPVALGKIIVYGDGAAFYERRVQITDGKLTIKIAREGVDAFVASVTAVDIRTLKPLPVAFPRTRAGERDAEATFDLPREVTDVVLTYVTAARWKPSYRVLVARRGRVMIEGWALIENTSAEDWRDVLVGIGTHDDARPSLSEQPMTVARGTSVMVPMVRAETDGEVVYVYELDRDRGEPHFAFKAVRVHNPSGTTLAGGPVTIYGDGKLLGEGVSDEIPPDADGMVAFALDRQIAVARDGATLTFASRLHTATTVYVRRTAAAAWLRVEMSPGATATVELP